MASKRLSNSISNLAFIWTYFWKYDFRKTIVFGKTFLWKNKFLSKEFLSNYFTMIVVWHMLILYDFTSPNYLTQEPKPKTQNVLVLEVLFFRTYSARSTDPVDRHAQLCMCISVDRRSTDIKVLALWKNQSTESVDRWAPTVGFLTVGGRPTRSTGLCQKFWQIQQLYFLTTFSFGICFQRISWGVFDPYK